MSVEIGGQDGGDFWVHGLKVDTDSLVLQQFQPLPRPLFVWKWAGKVTGKIINLASFLDGIGVFERCVKSSLTACEFGSRSYVDGENLPVRNGPVLCKTCSVAFDPPSRELNERGNKGREEIVKGYPGMEGVPLNPLEYIDDVGGVEQFGTSTGNNLPRYNRREDSPVQIAGALTSGQ